MAPYKAKRASLSLFERPDWVVDRQSVVSSTTRTPTSASLTLASLLSVFESPNLGGRQARHSHQQAPPVQQETLRLTLIKAQMEEHTTACGRPAAPQEPMPPGKVGPYPQQDSVMLWATTMFGCLFCILQWKAEPKVKAVYSSQITIQPKDCCMIVYPVAPEVLCLSNIEAQLQTCP